MSASDHFISQSLCVLTVSDTRTAANDASGDYLCASLTEAGHRLHERRLARDDRYLVRAIVAAWIADPAVDGILVTGGTGLSAAPFTNISLTWSANPPQQKHQPSPTP